MSEEEFVERWIHRANEARQAAHVVLSLHEGAGPSRSVVLHDLLQRLEELPVDVQDYFREATKCLQANLFRASVVMSWAGFFHVLAERLYHTQEKRLREERDKWEFEDLSELKANYPEFQIIEAAKAVRFIDKDDERIYKAQLTLRNKCAHPTLYSPSLNKAMAHVDDMIRQTIELLEKSKSE